MPEPTPEEIKESIKSLEGYKARLKKECTNMAKKLGMPPQRIEASLENHDELKRIEVILAKLNKQSLKAP